MRIAANVAREASNAKTQFLSSMSHDIRTPLNAVLGMTELAQSHANDPAYVQECLRKNLGVFVELYNLSWPAYLDARSKGDFDMTRASWTADYLSPESFLSNFLSDSPLNNSGWKNSEFDRAVFEQRYKDAQKIMDDNAVVLPLFYYKRIFLKSPLLKGWSTNKLDYHNYKSAHF